jgi:hypothetical protein
MIENQPMQKKEIPEFTDDDRIEEIERWMAKSHIDFRIVPSYLFEWMEKLKYIQHTDDDKYDLYRRATNIWGNELRNNAEFRGERKPYQRYLELQKSNFKNITDDDVNNIDMIYKKISVVEYYKNHKQHE